MPLCAAPPLTISNVQLPNEESNVRLPDQHYVVSGCQTWGTYVGPQRPAV